GRNTVEQRQLPEVPQVRLLASGLPVANDADTDAEGPGYLRLAEVAEVPHQEKPLGQRRPVNVLRSHSVPLSPSPSARLRSHCSVGQTAPGSGRIADRRAKPGWTRLLFSGGRMVAPLRPEGIAAAFGKQTGP